MISRLLVVLILGWYCFLVFLAVNSGTPDPPLVSLDWWLPLKLAVIIVPLYVLVLIRQRSALILTDLHAAYLPLAAWFVAFWMLQASGWWGIWCEGRACEYAGKEAGNFFIVEPPLVMLCSGVYLLRFLRPPGDAALIQSRARRCLMIITAAAVTIAVAVPALPD